MFTFKTQSSIIYSKLLLTGPGKLHFCRELCRVGELLVKNKKVTADGPGIDFKHLFPDGGIRQIFRINVRRRWTI
jgi:hypothetical protein